MLFEDDPFQGDLRRIDEIREIPLILEACRAATGMGFIAIARVTEERWITCASLDHLRFGLRRGDELVVNSTLCQGVRTCRETVVIPDVDASETYRDHPTPGRYGFKSYISVPIIRADGSFWGTLCAIDPEPRVLGPEVLTNFQLFARLVASELDREAELARERAALAFERDTARLREEFIAVVGHDLRNPITAISGGLRMLAKQPSEERMALIIPETQRSIARVEQIIANLLDFARGRLGGGIELVAPRPVSLEPVLGDVVREIERIASQPVEAEIDLPRPISADPQRLGQLLSNLLGNAVTHGAGHAPIRVEAHDQGGRLRLAVTNQGTPIPKEILPSLFAPFYRGGEAANPQGLGLGLYIASQIAQAHGGGIDVISDEDGTTFALTMPARYE